MCYFSHAGHTSFPVHFASSMAVPTDFLLCFNQNATTTAATVITSPLLVRLKGDTENDLRYRIGMPVIPAFWPRMASAGGVLSSATSPPPTPSPPLRTAVPGNNGLGLFGSALVPAGNGTELPWSWTRQRRRQRPRMVERRPIGFLYKRTVTVDGPDYSESTSRRVGHALFEMESKESGAGRAVHNARVGLVGKALHVLKCHHQANLLKGAG